MAINVRHRRRSLKFSVTARDAHIRFCLILDLKGRPQCSMAALSPNAASGHNQGFEIYWLAVRFQPSALSIRYAFDQTIDIK